MAGYTPEELYTRLREIAEDPAWSVVFRSMARQASAPNADVHGFAITPDDLSDLAVHTALIAAMIARAERVGIVDTAETIQARIDSLTGGSR